MYVTIFGLFSIFMLIKMTCRDCVECGITVFRLLNAGIKCISTCVNTRINLCVASVNTIIKLKFVICPSNVNQFTKSLSNFNIILALNSNFTSIILTNAVSYYGRPTNNHGEIRNSRYLR